MVDVVVLGAGPAGLGAAVYLAREGLDIMVYEKSAFGGLLNQIGDLQNYPGFTGSGVELMVKIREQAERFGARFGYGDCEEVRGESGGVRVKIDGKIVEARAALVATGCAPRKLELPGVAPERISYCAICDAPLYKGKSVLVVGGGNSAVQEGLEIAGFADRVTIMNRSAFRASRELLARAEANPRVELVAEVDPASYASEHKFDGYFVFIGYEPATECLPAEVLEGGYAVTDDGYMTSMPGVFAAGSVRKGAVNQVITGVGEGAAAAIAVARWLKTDN